MVQCMCNALVFVVFGMAIWIDQPNKSFKCIVCTSGKVCEDSDNVKFISCRYDEHKIGL